MTVPKENTLPLKAIRHARVVNQAVTLHPMRLRLARVVHLGDMEREGPPMINVLGNVMQVDMAQVPHQRSNARDHVQQGHFRLRDNLLAISVMRAVFMETLVMRL